MKRKELKKKWEEMKDQQGLLQRMDPSHPLDFFIGINTNGNFQLVLISHLEPAQIRSSKVLDIEKNIRKDGRWATQISLLDANNVDIFAKLCLDLVDSSYSATTEGEGLKLVTGRYLAWQKLFETMHDTLPISTLKGIVGEIAFATEYLSNHYSWDDVLEAWQGPDGADRDFILPNTWFEIKAVSTGKKTIGISSLEQLETDMPGYIVLLNVDESSSTDPIALPFSTIINQTRNLLSGSPIAAQKFEQKLVSVGYIDKKKYESIYFRYGEPTYFEVNDSFPRITNSTVPHGISEAKYSIDTVAIEGFKRRDWDIWK